MNLVRAFFPKIRHFSLNFEKGHGRPPPPPPPLVTRLDLYDPLLSFMNTTFWLTGESCKKFPATNKETPPNDDEFV